MSEAKACSLFRGLPLGLGFACIRLGQMGKTLESMAILAGSFMVRDCGSESRQVLFGDQGKREHRKRKAPQPVTQAMGTSKKGGEKVFINICMNHAKAVNTPKEIEAELFRLAPSYIHVYTAHKIC